MRTLHQSHPAKRVIEGKKKQRQREREREGERERERSGKGRIANPIFWMRSKSNVFHRLFNLRKN